MKTVIKLSNQGLVLLLTLFILSSCKSKSGVETDGTTSIDSTLVKPVDLENGNAEEPILVYDEILLDSLKMPYSIVDYFLLIPYEALSSGGVGDLEEKYLILNTVDNPVEPYQGGCFPNIDVLDEKNGFLSFTCNGDGGGHNVQIVYWKRDGQPDLVGINITTWGMCCDESEVRFFQFHEKKWEEITGKVFPEITYSNFLKKDYEGEGADLPAKILVSLPQKGKDILVRAAGEITEYEYMEEYPDLMAGLDLDKSLILEFTEEGFMIK